MGALISLNERQARILEHVVTDYVSTIVPVGSKRLTKRLGLSSASIRNAMSELEELGYIEKPHHSAGRVPTDKGYRFFVDALINEYNAARRRMDEARDSLDTLRSSLDQLFESIARRLSEWSDCLSFITIPEENRSEIKKLELTAISSHGLLVILVLGNGMVENRMVQMPVNVEELPLKRLSRAINSRLSGVRVCDVDQASLDRIFDEIRVAQEVLECSIRQFFEDLISTFGRRIYIEGPMRLVKQPEFQDPLRLRVLLEYLDASRDVADLFLPNIGEGGVLATIGREHGIEQLFECSSIKCNFHFGDRTTGAIGIIGPRRLEYPGMFELVEYTSNQLGRTLESLPGI